MAENAKCKCGKSSMNFPNLKQSEIEGKWENECCLEKKPAPKAEQKAPESKPEPKVEEPAKEPAKESRKRGKSKDEPKVK